MAKRNFFLTSTCWHAMALAIVIAGLFYCLMCGGMCVYHTFGYATMAMEPAAKPDSDAMFAPDPEGLKNLALGAKQALVGFYLLLFLVGCVATVATTGVCVLVAETLRPQVKTTTSTVNFGGKVGTAR